METIGIVGTGEMGWRMGRLLLDAGHRVLGYDISEAAMRQAASVGIETKRNLAELARESEIVITCVTDGAGLREVVAGKSGLLENLTSGRTIIDTTSAEPWITEDLAPLLAEKGIGFLDAPVSGGVPAAEAGKMNFMVGGDADLLEKCRPLLSRMGPVIHHVGPVGAGHKMKAINMLAMAGTFLATAEVLATAQEMGVDPKVLIDVLNESSGGSFVARLHYPRFILPGNYASGFTFDLMLKDITIGLDLARRVGVNPLCGSRTVQLYEIAARQGYTGKDNTRAANFIFEPKPVPAEASPSSDGADAPVERVGFIGLGAMGSRMVATLLRNDVKPTVFDIDRKAVKDAAAKGAVAASTPAEVVAASDAVLLSLPDAHIVEAVFHGKDGIAEGLERNPKIVVIDTSSSKAATTRAIGAIIRAKGGDMLDAPVSRGQPAAERGELSIIVGGAEATLRRCRWILDILGTDIVHCGGLGAGHVAKALNNLVNAANVIVGGEAVLIGVKAGLDPRTVVDVLCASSGGTEVLAKRYPQYVLTRKFNSNFRLGLMHKDASYGLELAGIAKVPAFLTGTAVSVYAAAMRDLGPDADNTEVAKLLEDWLGASFGGVQ